MLAGRRVWQQGVTLCVLVCDCREEVWWQDVILSVLVCDCREEGMVAGCNPQCTSFVFAGRMVL